MGQHFPITTVFSVRRGIRFFIFSNGSLFTLPNGFHVHVILKLLQKNNSHSYCINVIGNWMDVITMLEQYV